MPPRRYRAQVKVLQREPPEKRKRVTQNSEFHPGNGELAAGNHSRQNSKGTPGNNKCTIDKGSGRQSKGSGLYIMLPKEQTHTEFSKNAIYALTQAQAYRQTQTPALCKLCSS